jgi:transposase-like protein
VSEINRLKTIIYFYPVVLYARIVVVILVASMKTEGVELIMKHYSLKRKEAVIQQLMSPTNMSVSRLAAETGITRGTLYSWRQHAKGRGVVVHGDRRGEGLNTTALNATELAECCRKRYWGQIFRNRIFCLCTC